MVHCLRVPEEVERADVEPALIQHAVDQLASSTGLAVLAREKDWAPLGFEELDRTASEIQGEERVLWFRRVGDAASPRMLPVDRLIPRMPGKTRVDLFVNDRCPWDQYVYGLIRGVCASIGDSVVVYETDCSQRRAVERCGVAGGVALNGAFQPWLRPYRLPAEHEIRRAIEDAL